MFKACEPITDGALRPSVAFSMGKRRGDALPAEIISLLQAGDDDWYSARPSTS